MNNFLESAGGAGAAAAPPDTAERRARWRTSSRTYRLGGHVNGLAAAGLRNILSRKRERNRQDRQAGRQADRQTEMS